MCFSAAASYGAAAVLVPAGLYALHQTRRLPSAYWMIAMVPLLFGLQQGVEGRLWQLLDAGDEAAVRPLALLFLFFSHFLWPFWIPLASYLLETSRRRKRAFLLIALTGALGATVVYPPLVLFADWMSVEVIHHSIVYRVAMVYQEHLPAGLDRVIYALIVLTPLLHSSLRSLRIFGVLVALSLLLAAMLYSYAFISVWCFFAAVLSLYMVRVLTGLHSADGVGNSERG